MSDPIADRMTEEDRQAWEAAKAAGYANLRIAHEIYMRYALAKAKEVVNA